jgi:hypothetical protein
MKRIIICFLIVVLSFGIVYAYFSCKVHNEIDNGFEICNQIIDSVNLGENKLEDNVKGREKVDNFILEMKELDEQYINLTEYFSFIIDIDSAKEEIKKIKPEITEEEEIDKLINSVYYISDSFVEEETIFLNENGEKCIKVKDLRRLNTGDGIVKYFNGEYIIAKKDIPLTYTEMLEKELFVDKEKEGIEINGKVIQNSLLLFKEKVEDGIFLFKWRITGFSDIEIGIKDNEILKINIIEK